jgi:hypothetical protein
MARAQLYFLALAILAALHTNRPARAGDTTQTVGGQPDRDKAAKPSSPVMITTPADKGLVKPDALARGTFDSSVTDDIWVLICPEKTPTTCWPQSPDAKAGAPAVINKQKGEWVTPISFGGPAQSYEIAVYTASKDASTRIGKLLKKWAKANDYPGLAFSQRNGLEEQHRITVRKP